jgi:hypothetical protein
MLSGMKQKPRGTEDHILYWNACVFMAHGRASRSKHEDADQIWHGDLDVTVRYDKLQELATRLNKAIYVTPEQPWRFDGFAFTIKNKYDSERMVKITPLKD